MVPRGSFLGLLLYFAILHESYLGPSSPILGSYFKERQRLIEKSEDDWLGAKWKFQRAEQLVNDILMSAKNREFQEGFQDQDKFLASQHFFKSRPYIEQSKVYKVIQRVPKGASLHSHDFALVSHEYVFDNITFRDNLYAKEDENGKISMKFFKDSPGSPWAPISLIRNNTEDFDKNLKQQITLALGDDPDKFYTDANKAWTAFEDAFKTLTPLLTYKPVFRDYFYQALTELLHDNVKYLEVRGTLPQLYDLEGKLYGPEEALQVYYETSQQFMNVHRDFWGVKFIYAPHRFTNNSVLEGYANFISKMNKKFPNFIAGFDLVGHEDFGPPLKELIPSLLKIKKVTNLFFHAGETLWNGIKTDQNLIDAVLLNATRIGHAYSILKHPEVLELIKERNIALEICPISNQVLGLVRDFRNHPANFLIASKYPVVIASDDPGLWGAKALSYDYYVTFMGMTSKQADLRMLKQLALNSITYSSMDPEMKRDVVKQWEGDWRQFLVDVIYDFL